MIPTPLMRVELGKGETTSGPNRGVHEFSSRQDETFIPGRNAIFAGAVYQSAIEMIVDSIKRVSAASKGDEARYYQPSSMSYKSKWGSSGS
jgi:hypothetical protein